MTIKEANRLWKDRNVLILDFGVRFQEQTKSVISPLHDIEHVSDWTKKCHLSLFVGFLSLIFCLLIKFLSPDDYVSEVLIFITGGIASVCFSFFLGVLYMIKTSKSYGIAKEFCLAISLFEKVCQVKFGEHVKKIIDDPINPWIETFYLQAVIYAHVAKLKSEGKEKEIKPVVELAKTLVSINSFD